MIYPETQTDLSDFSDFPESSQTDYRKYKKRLQKQPVYIDKDGTVNIRAPFCPNCGSRKLSKNGNVLKRTKDILGETFYFSCQQYRCHRCSKTFSAFIKNIIVYDEQMVTDKIIMRIDDLIKISEKNTSQIHQLGEKFIELIETLITNNISLNMSSKARYSKEEIVELVVRNSINTTFMETTRNLLDIHIDREQIPSADTALLYIGRKTLNELRIEAKMIFKRLIEEYRRRGLLSQPIDIAVDYHDVEYYGQQRDEKVIKSKSKNGTNFFHEYVTIDSVEDGQRFTLTGEHISQFDDKFVVVQKQIDFIRRNNIPLNIVFLDREFFNTKIIDYLIENDLTFLMPVVKNKKVSRMAEKEYNRGNYVFTYRFGKGKSVSKPFTVFTITNPEYDVSQKTSKSNPRYFIFATNIKIDASDRSIEIIQDKTDLSGYFRKDIAELYSKRWGIETDYRVLDHEFFGKTTSNKMSIRYFYVMMGISLRNIWELSRNQFTNMFGRLFPKNTITARTFSRIIEKTFDRRQKKRYLYGARRIFTDAHIM